MCLCGYCCCCFWCQIIPGISVFSHPWTTGEEAKPWWCGVKEHPLRVCFLWLRVGLGGGCGLLLDARDGMLMKQGVEGTGTWIDALGGPAPAWASDGTCCLGHWWLSFQRKASIFCFLPPSKFPVAAVSWRSLFFLGKVVNASPGWALSSHFFGKHVWKSHQIFPNHILKKNHVIIITTTVNNCYLRELRFSGPSRKIGSSGPI